MDIEMSDLMSVCRILDAVIKKRVAEENEHLDRTTNQPMTQLEAGFHACGLEQPRRVAGSARPPLLQDPSGDAVIAGDPERRA